MFFKTLVGVLFVVYPAIVYFGLSHNMAWIGLLLLILFCVQKAVVSDEKRLQYVVLIAILTLGAWIHQSVTIKLLPIAIHSGLFVLFWQSLRAGKPLIEQFARLDFPDMPDGIPEYCSNVTKIWTAFFAFNIFLCLILAIWASDEIWAVYNGLIVYGLIGLLVVGEYVWRRLKFPWLEIPSFKDTAISISKNGHKIWGPDR